MTTFFVGWAPRAPAGLRGFLAVLALCLVAGAGLLGFALSASVDDPGAGSFDWAAGEQTLRGTITPLPYPLLTLPPTREHPAGHTVLLSGEGKRGVALAPSLAGRVVDATGLMLKRGTIDMMQVDDDPGLGRPRERRRRRPRLRSGVAPGRRDLRWQVLDRGDAAGQRPRSQGVRQPVPRRRASRRCW